MKPIEIQDLLEYRYLSGLALSPDNRHIAFVVQQAASDQNSYIGSLYLYDTVSQTTRMLTSGGREKSFFWLDGSTILFPGLRDPELRKKKAQGEPWTAFYAIDIRGGEACEHMRIPLEVISAKPLDSRRFVLLARTNSTLPDFHALSQEEQAACLREGKDYTVLDEIPYCSNGRGYTSKWRQRLYFYDRSSGELRPITGELENVSFYQVQGEEVLYISSTYREKYNLTSALTRYHIQRGSHQVLVEDGVYKMEYAGFWGEEIFLAATDMKRYAMNESPNFYWVREGRLVLLAENDFSIHSSMTLDCKLGGGSGFSLEGDTFSYITTRGGSDYIATLSQDGRISLLGRDNGSIECFARGKEGEYYFIGTRGTRLQELYCLRDGVETQLTACNEEYRNSHTVCEPVYFPIEKKGLRLDGWVIPPADFDECRVYPGILSIHGGPKTAYGAAFLHEMQVLAAKGYFVFYVNPRGSDGRGDAFSDIRNQFGRVDYEDFMDFTDQVLEAYPQIDRERLGVTGGSYGGYMTNWIIGHTHRFACAVSQRSISDWITKILTTDIGYYYNADQVGGMPWPDPTPLWDCSPLKYASQVKTPTLFLHSDQDFRCWMAEGLQMFTALKLHGVQTRLCLFHGENHELSRSGTPRHRIRRLKEMTDWFQKYLE